MMTTVDMLAAVAVVVEPAGGGGWARARSARMRANLDLPAEGWPVITRVGMADSDSDDGRVASCKVRRLEGRRCSNQRINSLAKPAIIFVVKNELEKTLTPKWILRVFSVVARCKQ